MSVRTYNVQKSYDQRRDASKKPAEITAKVLPNMYVYN